MIYEWRIYEVVPGKMPNIVRRFGEITNALFQRHGIDVVGYWTTTVGANDQFVYMLRWKDMTHRQEVWAKFQADPEWQQKRAETVKDGEIVARVTNSILTPTSYSPLQ